MNTNTNINNMDNIDNVPVTNIPQEQEQEQEQEQSMEDVLPIMCSDNIYPIQSPDIAHSNIATTTVEPVHCDGLELYANAMIMRDNVMVPSLHSQPMMGAAAPRPLLMRSDSIAITPPPLMRSDSIAITPPPLMRSDSIAITPPPLMRSMSSAITPPPLMRSMSSAITPPPLMRSMSCVAPPLLSRSESSYGSSTSPYIPNPNMSIDTVFYHMSSDLELELDSDTNDEMDVVVEEDEVEEEQKETG